MGKYFGTNGVRGKFDFLTPELAMEIAKAIGVYFKRGRIIIARDARLTGECLSYAVFSGLQSVGCDVIDLDYASAPAAEFMVKELKADGLIIITASHNPPEWNALKVVDRNGITISSERAVDIEKLIGNCENVGWEKVGTLKRADYVPITNDYIETILKHVDKEKIIAKKPKIVLDYGNGTAVIAAPVLFGRLDCEIVGINEKMDGRFPGRHSEPTKDNVKELIERVKKEKADCGIAWDGDADRVIFVDEKGEYVVGDKVFALSVLWKLSGAKKINSASIVTTVATSKAAEDVAARFGAKTIYTKIGAPYLSEEMAKGKAIIGGEEVGGVIWP
ncbi:MAG: phosphoglucosamine mutase, partial [Candidatus Micrarchaeia archaeon]